MLVTAEHESGSRASRPAILTVEALGERLPLTLGVERAAKVVGISRTAMYAAVRRGDFDVIELNGRVAVLTVPLLLRIGLRVSE